MYLLCGRGTNSERLSDRLLEGTIDYVILFQINIRVKKKILAIVIRREEKEKKYFRLQTYWWEWDYLVNGNKRAIAIGQKNKNT